MSLQIRPCDYCTAKEFVNENHRHHKAPPGHKFSISCYDGERLCGVAMVGRPVGRRFDDGMTLEVNRCCTDGTKNACSMLYSAAWRAAKALGYRRIITYTLKSESGASLRSAGWTYDGEAGGLHWTGGRYEQMQMELNGVQQIRPPEEMKIRWKKEV